MEVHTHLLTEVRQLFGGIHDMAALEAARPKLSKLREQLMELNQAKKNIDPAYDPSTAKPYMRYVASFAGCMGEILRVRGEVPDAQEFAKDWTNFLAELSWAK